jgi:WD40 repeat protein/energy-coupling factor transporter ATP-binding protein EcfA2
MDNTLGNVSISGNSAAFTYAPVQIGTKVDTQIIQISAERITQRELNKSSPYKGLRRYNFADRAYFFGRDALIARLFEAVNQNRMLLVTGASGCGKSSVIRAGVIPELKSKLGTTQLHAFVFSPGNNPFESLYRCLLADDKDYQFSEAEAEIARNGDGQTLVNVVQTLKQSQNRWLFFIDQFEEIFTNCRNQQTRENFVNALGQLNQLQDDSVRTIIAMRADFLEYFSSFPQLGAIANSNNIHVITDMHPDELRQAIEQPAAKHGVVFEEGLVEQITKEVQGQSGYLPLLQYTLNLLWERECIDFGQDHKPHIEDRTLNRSTYARLEGVRGALQAHINEVYQKLNQDEQDATRQIFLRLVQIVETDSGSRAVSRKAHRNEFQGELLEATLRTFVDENMIVSGYEYSDAKRVLTGKIPALTQNATFEVAHEIILSSWDSLKQWIDESKDAIIFKNFLADDVDRWQIALSQASSTDNQSIEATNDELLKGSRLERAIQLRENNAFFLLGGLSELENQFIDRSIEWQAEQIHRKAEFETAIQKNYILAQAHQKAKRIIRRGVVVLCVVIPITGFASWRAVRALEDLAIARKGTQLEQAGVSALRQFRSGELEALVSSLRAGYELQNLVEQETGFVDYPSVSPMLAMQRILSDIHEKNRYDADQGEIKQAVFSPDHQYIATAGRDGTVQLWTVDGEPVKTLGTPNDTPLGAINDVQFDSKGETLFTVTEDGRLWRWSLSETEPSLLREEQRSLNSVHVSPYSSRLVVTSKSGQGFLLSTEGEQLAVLQGPQAPMSAAVFNPDGSRIAGVSTDGQIYIWTSDGQLSANWQGHDGDPITSVSFSPDGNTLATAGGDRTIRLWNLSGQELRVFRGHLFPVTTVQFSPQGDLIASGDDGGRVKLWDLEDIELMELPGHRGVIWSANFSADGQLLLTAGRDGNTRLWKVSELDRGQLFAGHQDDVNAVAVSPDAQWVASAGDEGQIRVWDQAGHPKANWAANGQPRIYSMAFSSDGEYIATGDADGAINIWTLSGDLKQSLRGHRSWVSSVTFSPDGRWIAGAGADQTARLWNLEGQQILELSDHRAVVYRVAFSRDSQMIATGDWEGNVGLWNLDGKKLAFWKAHDTQIRGISFAENSNTLVTGDKFSTVRFWSLTGELTQEFFSYQSGINSLQVSPDGLLIATGGMDSTTKIWDLSGRQTAEYLNSLGSVWDIAFTPDGQSILVGGDEGFLKSWKIFSLDELLSASCKWLDDYLQTSVEHTLRDKCIVQPEMMPGDLNQGTEATQQLRQLLQG